MVETVEIKNLQSLKEHWLQVAQSNPWISQRGSGNSEDDCAFERALELRDFLECTDLDELIYTIKRGNWILGEAFYVKYKHDYYCFINQVNGGDEWLTFKNETKFESMTFEYMPNDTIKEYFERWSTATNEQLKACEY